MRVLFLSGRMRPTPRPHGGCVRSTLGEDHAEGAAGRGDGEGDPHRDSGRLFGRQNHCTHQPVRELYSGRTSGGRWSDGPQDHRGHIRWMGGTRGRRLLRQRFHQGGQVSSVRRPLGCQVTSQGRSVSSVSGPGILRYRRG
uniref:Uncharacterized protein n=1 Tax=Cacopsylla melanoneura TaxID=428564 RepID=A0A8D8SYN6_9HEMI